MPKGKPASPAGRVRAPRRRARSRWLLLIDNEPIRRRALADYEKLEKQSGAVRRQLEAYETGDLPAYVRWEASAFGALLSELRALTASISEKQRILDAIEDEVCWSGCSRVTAYRRIVLGAQKPGATEERDFEESVEDEPDTAEGPRLFGDSDLPPGFDGAKFEQMPPRERREFREFYQAMAELFEMMTGRAAPSLEEALEGEGARLGGNVEPPLRQSRAGVGVDPEGDRIKELYRRLVRQLHPDSSGRTCARDRELWHEVQEAYGARDLSRLEALAGRIEIGLMGSSAKLPVQTLLRMTRDLRDALRGLRRQLAAARKQPAWDFARLASGPGLERLANSRRAQLEERRRAAQNQLTAFTAMLDSLATRAARPRAPRKKTRPAPTPTPRTTQMSF